MDDAPKTHVLGFLSTVVVPQSWFAHFYAVGVLWNALVIALVGLQCCLSASSDMRDVFISRLRNTLILGTFQVHLVRRLVETIFMMKYPRDAKMHIMAYVFGIRCAPLCVSVSAVH